MEDVAGCKACNMTGWILTIEEDGQPIARPCKCLYEVAKKIISHSVDSETPLSRIMNKKKPMLKEVQSIRAAEDVVRIYEHHEKKETS